MSTVDNSSQGGAESAVFSASFGGRVALVTGGGSGIGQGIALRLAELGAHVGLVGRDESKLLTTKSQVETAGGSATVLPGDVRDRDFVDAAESSLVESVGSIDLLVNAAAGNFRAKPEDLSPRGWSSVVDIVLDGTWNWCQAVGRRAISDSKPAVMLNIASLGAMYGGPDTVHSASAKGGVLAMTKSLASAWGRHGIRANVLTPGVIGGTPGVEVLLDQPGVLESIVSDIPLGRPGTHREIVDTALFLLSDFASYISGANLVVDGGRSLGRPWAPAAG